MLLTVLKLVLLCDVQRVMRVVSLRVVESCCCVFMQHL